MDLMIINQHRVFPYRKEYQIAKRVMDVGLCLLAIPFILPLMAMISILIYLDSPGPVFFVQENTGRGGRRFRLHKFRTMVPNAEELKAKYAHLNELSWPSFRITNDPRVTRVGRFLRKTSLDELPQILNVLKGDMSLVGPRPLADYLVEPAAQTVSKGDMSLVGLRPSSVGVNKYNLWHTERLEVLPGITGLAQVSGRNNLDTREKMMLDIAYIERQSLWLDLQILARTVKIVLSSEGASY
jgi:lipopolysaccharide/colanic/teichoic acid biosynthesis glycosyltransferase